MRTLGLAKVELGPKWYVRYELYIEQFVFRDRPLGVFDEPLDAVSYLAKMPARPLYIEGKRQAVSFELHGYFIKWRPSRIVVGLVQRFREAADVDRDSRLVSRETSNPGGSLFDSLHGVRSYVPSAVWP